MEYPKLTFKKLSLSDNIEIIKWAYSQEDSLDTKNKVIEFFPSINKDNIDEVVTSEYNKLSKIFDESINNYREYWNSISSEYLSILFNYLNIDSYEDSLTVFVGILPIAPRDINNREIYINIGMEKNNFLNIITHEVLHFVWFSKFKSLFPEISYEEFNAPNFAWIYSELLTPIILNLDSIVKLTHTHEECLYDFMSGEVMNSLKNIFDNNNQIDERIREGYEYIKDHFNNK